MGNMCATKQKPSAQMPSQYKIQTLATPEETAHYNQGRDHENKAEYNKAISAYTKAIRTNPQSDLSFNGLGNCSVFKGQLNQAITYYQKAIQINPQCKYAYNGLGTVYRNLQQSSKSIANYNKAIAIDPTFSYPYNGLANLYYQYQNYQQALPYYIKASRLSPNNALMYANLACCQIMMGRYEDSFDSFVNAKKMVQMEDKELSQPNRVYLMGKLAEFEAVVKKADPKHKNKFVQIMSADSQKKSNSNSDQANDKIIIKSRQLKQIKK